MGTTPIDMAIEIVLIPVTGEGVEPGPNPKRNSYASYASFTDPDGNGFVIQEITARLGPGLALDDPRFTPEVLAAIHPSG